MTKQSQEEEMNKKIDLSKVSGYKKAVKKWKPTQEHIEEGMKKVVYQSRFDKGDCTHCGKRRKEGDNWSGICVDCLEMNKLKEIEESSAIMIELTNEQLESIASKVAKKLAEQSKKELIAEIKKKLEHIHKVTDGISPSYETTIQILDNLDTSKSNNR